MTAYMSQAGWLSALLTLVLLAQPVSAAGLGPDRHANAASGSMRVADARSKDEVIAVPDGDAEMNAAIAKARRTLDNFWDALETQRDGETGYALKVQIEDRNGVEHFWLTDIERDGKRIVGTIDNDPNLVRSVRLGQRFEFTDADISDWSFMRNGKIVGNQTLRPLLKRMPAELAEKYRQLLEEP